MSDRQLDPLFPHGEPPAAAQPASLQSWDVATVEAELSAPGYSIINGWLAIHGGMSAQIVKEELAQMVNRARAAHVAPAAALSPTSENPRALEALEQLSQRADLRVWGWDTYGARPIDDRAIEAARKFLGYAWAVVPTANGGIQLEMHSAGFDIEIEWNDDGSVDGAFAELFQSAALSPSEELPVTKDSKLVRRIVNAVIQADTAALADQYVAEILQEALAPLSPAPTPSVQAEQTTDELTAIRTLCLDAGMTEASTTLMYLQGVFYRLHQEVKR